ncbi:GNAT family N-acetyltransferase [Aeromicrobium sp.]|uniref:GNAT family N-acetyltransferase n=1 Tax=Aeromicrobium sp. TaxID=1871063 RepID=UPI003D6BB3A3
MIRKAAPDDVRAITLIERTSFGDGVAWSAATVENELTAPGRIVLVDDRDQLLVGYASAAVIDDVADLTRIAVRPLARRRKVGTDLLRALLLRTAAKGAARMMLEVAATNEAALGLYRVIGFDEIARRGDYYARGIDAVIMERRIGR